MRDDKYNEYKVFGNNAVVTERKIEKRELEKNEKLEKAKKERRLRELTKQRQQKKNIMQIVALVFIFGIIIIGRNATIYSMQKQLVSINSEIKEVRNDNESLKIELLKVSSLENIKNYAEKNLKMVNPDKSTIIRHDISKNNFTEQTESNINKTLLSKIKDALF